MFESRRGRHSGRGNVARKLLLIVVLLLIPGGLFMIGAALLASGVGKRFPQISQRLRNLSWRNRRGNDVALPSASA